MSSKVPHTRETTVNIFDHLKDPTQDIPARAILHCIKILPFVADALVNHLVDKLDNENLFRHKIKHDLNQLRRLIDGLVIKNNESEGSNIFAGDFGDKIEAMMIQYATTLVGITDAENMEQYLEKVASNAVFLYKAKPGDTFTFLDENAEFCEYTYIGFHEIPDSKEFGCLYCKHNIATPSLRNPEPVKFTELNIYRPILITTPETLREKLDNHG